MNSSGPGLFKVTVTPTQGIAPLDVAFTVENPSNTPFASIEFDVNGDGAVDYTATSIATANPIFTLQPGYSMAKVTVRGAGGGAIYTFTQAIYVYTAMQKYNFTKGVLNAMLDRLKAGNGDAASSLFIASQRDSYKAYFASLGSSLSNVANQLGIIRGATFADGFAELVIVRDTPEGPTAFPIHLIRDADAIWRIESM
jgi:PKD repeat protein